MVIPVEMVFNPHWWFRNYGISFDRSFYLDKEVRIENDVKMRAALFDRYGAGEKDPQPRPVIGSMHVAGGFVLPALFGVEIRFGADHAPWPVERNMTKAEILALRPPELYDTWPTNKLIEDMDFLEKEYGYVVGDVDTDGIFNTALHLRGQQLFIDLYEDPELVHHLFTVLSDTYVSLASLLRARTGTCSVATNRSILNVNPSLYVHSNCSVQMISPRIYEKLLLPYELVLAHKLQPYGIHHCGNNLHQFVDLYGKVPADFFDVGWGSDVARCRKALPDAFLNLRLSPVRMLHCQAAEICQDVRKLLSENQTVDKVGICCINMDYETPDENVQAMAATARDF